MTFVLQQLIFRPYRLMAKHISILQAAHLEPEVLQSKYNHMIGCVFDDTKWRKTGTKMFLFLLGKKKKNIYFK